MASSAEETIRSPDPRELFDRGLELFARGQAEESVAVLREAFFGNIFIAPALLGRALDPAGVWIPGPSAGADAAKAYARDQRKGWQSVPNALRYLRGLWDDPLVRREIQSYANFCKSFARSHERSAKVTAEMLAEREKFTNRRRIRSTQKEIIERIREYSLGLPPAAPRLGTVTLVAPEAERIADFLKRVLGAALTYHVSTESWSVDLAGVALKIAAGEGAPSGVEMTVEVTDFDYYVQRLEDAGIPVASSQASGPRNRFLLLEGPAGLRLRLIEREEPA